MKPTKIDLNRLDLEKEREKTTETPGLIAFPHMVGGALIRPEDKGKIKGRALAAMREQTNRQLQQLYRQAQLLADQAKEIQKRAEISETIYEADMNFEPLIGHRYHLYQRPGGEHLLSMIGPQEWGRSKRPGEHLASVTLLADHTWELVEEG
ncbi:DUF2452 domain-containing protein [Cesiribacter andamanensis]|uniref:DUF2452 domain-containing protein n=1 Tax=Cesiribacter andamanensis AMV16 TaxID=1279009 RepID=M7NHU0_9BACT|nr:DUF2452 domain-containing protein [Cesiribacter andamanensis]EMR01370.1 hypothetical protein ADICEAN_03503 [Cesiribacter andamanensis AMV16]